MVALVRGAGAAVTSAGRSALRGRTVCRCGDCRPRPLPVVEHVGLCPGCPRYARPHAGGYRQETEYARPRWASSAAGVLWPRAPRTRRTILVARAFG